MLPPRLRSGRRSPRSRALRLGGALTVVALLATGCGVDWSEAARLGAPEAVTPQGERMLRQFQGSAVAAIAVGAFVWFLIGFAAIAFRKRTEELPQQVRYNLPVEVLYTAVPFIIVAVFFYFTLTDEIYVNELSDDPDVTVNVVGFQWNWQFQYEDGDGNPDNDVQVTGRPGQNPELVLPVGQTVRFFETSPDVAHSFWVPAFLFKRDVIPGRVNQFELTIDEPGTYVGRCAELCGTYHTRMLFSVRAVSPAEYQSYLTAARSGATSSAAGASTTPGGTS